MARYLVVANRTLDGKHLVSAVERRIAHYGSCEVHIVVPHSEHTAGVDAGELDEDAVQARLDAATRAFEAVGATVTSERGGEDPVAAVRAVLDGDPAFDEILLSTLPPGPSRWLGLDIPHRLQRTVHIPVSHLVASPPRLRPKLFG